jgi:hypothetical protein
MTAESTLLSWNSPIRGDNFKYAIVGDAFTVDYVTAAVTPGLACPGLDSGTRVFISLTN